MYEEYEEKRSRRKRVQKDKQQGDNIYFVKEFKFIDPIFVLNIWREGEEATGPGRAFQYFTALL